MRSERTSKSLAGPARQATHYANAADLLARIHRDVNPEWIRVDGGSEFCGCFETACRRIDLHLLVLPLKSPKLNCHIESSDATLVRGLINFRGCLTV